MSAVRVNTHTNAMDVSFETRLDIWQRKDKIYRTQSYSLNPDFFYKHDDRAVMLLWRLRWCNRRVAGRACGPLQHILQN